MRLISRGPPNPIGCHENRGLLLVLKLQTAKRATVRVTTPPTNRNGGQGPADRRTLTRFPPSRIGSLSVLRPAGTAKHTLYAIITKRCSGKQVR